MANLRYLEDVTTLQLDTEKCIGCKKCTEVCPHGVFIVANGKAQIVDRSACMECGACALNCMPGAITVQSGVGCAAGIINGIIKGTGPTCDCGGPDNSTCC